MKKHHLLMHAVLIGLNFNLLFAQGTLERVPVGNPGNGNDSLTNFGTVSYAYEIGKYPVTTAQYAEFLNAMAASDPNGLYHPSMAMHRLGSSGSFSYVAHAGRELWPIYFVSLYDAARFANWMTNGRPTGSQGPATTEDGMYDMAVGDFARKRDFAAGQTGWAVASSAEWYKAAYYNSSSQSYSRYATGSDQAPVAEQTPGGVNSANYNNVYGYVSPVGAYTQSTSSYGTFDQDGNVFEWNDTADVTFTSNYLARGGSFFTDSNFLGSMASVNFDPTTERSDLGFRVSFAEEIIDPDPDPDPNDEEIDIPDANFFAALLEVFGKTEGPITRGDMESLTTLNLANRGITDFTGLEAAVNLRILNLMGNQPSDPVAFYQRLDALGIWCVYSSVPRPEGTTRPANMTEVEVTTSSGESLYIGVDPSQLETLNLTDGIIDLENPDNLAVLEELNDQGIALDNGEETIPPVARFSITYSETLRSRVTLNASASSDIDGTVESYEWTWIDLDTGEQRVRTGLSFTEDFPSGYTDVTLTVTDNDNASTSLTQRIGIFHMPDPVLRQAVRDALSLPENSPITLEDMANLRILDLSYLNIVELEGLQLAVNLEFLGLMTFYNQPLLFGDLDRVFQVLDSLPAPCMIYHRLRRPENIPTPTGQVIVGPTGYIDYSNLQYSYGAFTFYPEEWPKENGRMMMDITDWPIKPTGSISIGSGLFRYGRVFAVDYDVQFVDDSRTYSPDVWGLEVAENKISPSMVDYDGEIVSVTWELYRIPEEDRDIVWEEQCTEDDKLVSGEVYTIQSVDLIGEHTGPELTLNLSEFQAARLMVTDNDGEEFTKDFVWQDEETIPLVRGFEPKPGESEVTIPDSVLLSAVKAAVGKSDTDPVTNLDLFDLRYLSLRDLPVGTLTGLHELYRLEVLDLRGTSVALTADFLQQLSPTAVVYVDSVPQSEDFEEVPSIHLRDAQGGTFWLLTVPPALSNFSSLSTEPCTDYWWQQDDYIWWDNMVSGSNPYKVRFNVHWGDGPDLLLRENRIALREFIPTTVYLNFAHPEHNLLPVADMALIVHEGVPGDTVTLSAKPSFDLDGSIVTYSWYWTDPVDASPRSANGNFASLQLPEGESLEVNLVVTDNDGATDQITRSITMPKRPGALQIETHQVGLPGNDPIVASDSAVGLWALWEVLTGDNEVSTQEYTDFLNAVAAQVDPKGLYYMSEWAQPPIVRSESNGNFSYSTPFLSDVSVWDIPFWNAVRYANWKHNGRPNGAAGPATTEDGLYDLSDPVVVKELGLGDVSYTFYMSVSEVTNAQYAYFLNAVASESDPKGLYHPKMSGEDGGILRVYTGSGYAYAPVMGRENHPVNFVSFWSAARFANWMTNGQPTGPSNADTTEDGMYDLTDPLALLDNTVSRKRDFAQGENGIAIADDDEWFKARYFNTDAGGYVIGTGSDWVPPWRSLVNSEATSFELSVRAWTDTIMETTRKVFGPFRNTYSVELDHAGIPPHYGYASVGFRLTSLTPMHVDPPTITSVATLTVTAGQSLAFQVTASDFANRFAAEGLPAWISLQTDTGLMQLDPPAPGLVSFDLRASGPGGEGEPVNVQVRILPNPEAPKITSLAGAAGRAGENFNFTLTADSPAYPSVTWVVETLPGGLNLNTSTGVISGIPTESGLFELEVQASNAAGVSEIQNFELTLLRRLVLPVITSADVISTAVGIDFSHTVEAANQPDTFTFSGLPSDASQVGTTGEIGGMFLSPGEHTFSVFATNADGNSETLEMRLVVDYSPEAPVILGATRLSGMTTFPFESQVQLQGDVDSFEVSGLPAGMAFDPSTGILSGVPQESGTFTVRIRGYNAFGAGPEQEIVLFFEPLPEAPVIPPQLLPPGRVGNDYMVQILAQGSPIHEYQVSGLPPGLFLNANTGRISGVPLRYGRHTLKVTASNLGGISLERELELLIRVAAQAPRIEGEPFWEIQQGEVVSYPILATPGPITGYRVTGLPRGLGVNVETGLIEGRAYTPGEYSVELIAVNLIGESEPFQLRILVKAAPTAPWITNSSAEYFGFPNEPGLLLLTATNMPDTPFLDGSRFEVESLPEGMELNEKTGELTGFLFASGTLIRARAWREATPGNWRTLWLYHLPPSQTRRIIGPSRLTGYLWENLNFSLQGNVGGHSRYQAFFPNGRSHFSSSPTFSVSLTPELVSPGLNRVRTYTQNHYYRRYCYSYRSGWWGRTRTYCYSYTSYYNTSQYPIALNVRLRPDIPRIAMPESLSIPYGPTYTFTPTSEHPLQSTVLLLKRPYSTGYFTAARGGAQLEFYPNRFSPGAYDAIMYGFTADGRGTAPESFNLFITNPVGSVAVNRFVPDADLLSSPQAARSSAMNVESADAYGRVGVFFSETLDLTDEIDRVTITGLPEGLGFQPFTGVISGIPTEPGRFDLQIETLSASDLPGISTLVLLINPADGAPESPYDVPPTATAGEEWSWSPGYTPPVQNVILIEAPEWLLVSTESNTFYGTPPVSEEVSFVWIAVNEAGQSAPMETILEVESSPEAPDLAQPEALDILLGSSPPSESPVPSFGDALELEGEVNGLEWEENNGYFQGQPHSKGSFALRLRGWNEFGAGPWVDWQVSVLENAFLNVQEQLQLSGLTGENADPWSIPFADGLPNLLKYAFNLRLDESDAQPLQPDGSRGLPAIRRDASDDSQPVFFEFVRRRHSTLRYIPEQSHSLEADNWQVIPSVEEVTPVDENWERVRIYPDVSGEDPLFMRMRVELP